MSTGNRRQLPLVAIAGPTNRYRKRVAEAAIEHVLPTIAAMKEFALDGGLLSYGPDFPEMYRSGATVVDKILRGQCRVTFQSSFRANTNSSSI